MKAERMDEKTGPFAWMMMPVKGMLGEVKDGVGRPKCLMRAEEFILYIYPRENDCEAFILYLSGKSSDKGPSPQEEDQVEALPRTRQGKRPSPAGVTNPEAGAIVQGQTAANSASAGNDGGQPPARRCEGALFCRGRQGKAVRARGISDIIAEA